LANVEPVQIVEIDIDYCTLTYGTGLCTAVLGTTGVRKCFNTFATCQAKPAFDKGIKTLKFITPTASVPKDDVYFPALTSVSAFSTSVNIGGASPSLGALGKRGKVSVSLKDFAYHDRYLDKYQSERVSGAAQNDEGGYDPATRGSFFTKLKSRFPFYAGRPLRVIDGYVDGGVFTELQTRYFIITNIVGPNDGGNVSIEAKDILTLAEKKSATAPVASRGQLLTEVPVGLVSFDLTPAGIGSEYPASGTAVVGSEIVTYTRSSDTITLTGRGLYNTEESDHKAGDTFQECIVYTNQLINQVVEDLLTNYTDIDPSFFPTADWAEEVQRWAPTLRLDTVIAEPTSVSDLLGELAVLGVSIWWDDVGQKVRLAVTKPVDLNQTVYNLTDDANIKSISQEDRDEDRLTQIHFYTVQADPTAGLKDKSNYDRIRVTVDTEAEQANSYNDTRVREIFCRWLNFGNETSTRLRSIRLLNKLNASPKQFKIKLDAKDIAISLTDVLYVESRVITDDTGKPVPTYLEVTQKSEPIAGHEVDVVAQAYLYEGNYGYIMDDEANPYGSATDLEKETGAYISDTAGVIFTDEPYVII
jgi:hypothetical protein